MVERTLNFNDVFASLADETRRNILALVSKQALTISQIADNNKLTYGAISKHILVLEKAKLVMKKRRGKEQLVQIAPQAMGEAEEYLRNLSLAWEERFDALENYLVNNKET
jgi:DNA-binding transcriptional ArsR family regulator